MVVVVPAVVEIFLVVIFLAFFELLPRLVVVPGDTEQLIFHCSNVSWRVTGFGSEKFTMSASICAEGAVDGNCCNKSQTA